MRFLAGLLLEQHNVLVLDEPSDELGTPDDWTPLEKEVNIVENRQVATITTTTRIRVRCAAKKVPKSATLSKTVSRKSIVEDTKKGNSL